MRIVGWAEFSKMSPSTVFQIARNQKGEWGDLQVLVAVWSFDEGRGDFIPASLLPVVMPASLISDANRKALGLHGPEGDTDMVTVHPDML